MKMDQITRSINKGVQKTKKNSPHIFFGLGIVGTVASNLMVIRATMKLEDWIEETERVVAEYREALDYEDDEKSYEYRILCVKQLAKLGKLYGPAILTQVVSIAALSGAHVQMTKRNGALVAALVAISQGHESYREQVIEEVGVEKEREIVDKSEWNAFTRIFDETNPCYHKDVELNRRFLHFCQDTLNEVLRKKGVVRLNDAYDMLGYDRTREGFMYGWTYGGGITEIDLGLFEEYNSRFINGLERAVILNFNVDGVLHDYM